MLKEFYELIDKGIFDNCGSEPQKSQARPAEETKQKIKFQQLIEDWLNYSAEFGDNENRERFTHAEIFGWHRNLFFAEKRPNVQTALEEFFKALKSDYGNLEIEISVSAYEGLKVKSQGVALK